MTIPDQISLTPALPASTPKAVALRDADFDECEGLGRGKEAVVYKVYNGRQCFARKTVSLHTSWRYIEAITQTAEPLMRWIAQANIDSGMLAAVTATTTCTANEQSTMP